MPNPFALYSTDKKAVTDGKWYTDSDGSRYLLASMSSIINPRYAASLEKHTKPYRRQLDAGTLSREKRINIYLKPFAETVLLDWETCGPDGKELPYSTEKVKWLMLTLPELYGNLTEVAANTDFFRGKVEEAELGNLKNTSSGGKTTPKKKTSAKKKEKESSKT